MGVRTRDYMVCMYNARFINWDTFNVFCKADEIQNHSNSLWKSWRKDLHVSCLKSVINCKICNTHLISHLKNVRNEIWIQNIYRASIFNFSPGLPSYHKIYSRIHYKYITPSPIFSPIFVFKIENYVGIQF